MQYWKPSNDLSLNGPNQSIGTLAASGSMVNPTIELPVVGDKILLSVGYHGYVQLVDPTQVMGGQEFVEVEVIAIKKSTTSLE